MEDRREIMSRPALSDTIGLLREILSAPEFSSDQPRRAALRRTLAAASVGLTAPEADLLVDAIRSYFPDRTYESSAQAEELGDRVQNLEREVAALRKENEELQTQVRTVYRGLDRLVQSVVQAEGGALVGGASTQAPREPERLDDFFAALGLLAAFAIREETIARSVEDSLGRRSGRPIDGEPLAKLLKTLARGEAGAGGPATTQEVQQKLDYLGLVPAAMMAGVNQSWKSGTTAILEYLHPDQCEKEISGKIPGLKDVAVLKEVRRRFQEFWNHLDQNVAHYYRGTFERIYAEKMEE